MKGTWHLCSSHEAEVQQYVANQSATGAQHRQQRRPSALPALYSTALLNLVKSWVTGAASRPQVHSWEG